jgi:hypothetical protein
MGGYQTEHYPKHSTHLKSPVAFLDYLNKEKIMKLPIQAQPVLRKVSSTMPPQKLTNAVSASSRGCNLCCSLYGPEYCDPRGCDCASLRPPTHVHRDLPTWEKRS